MAGAEARPSQAEKVWVLDDRLRDQLMALTDGAVAACFQCGVCTATCTWGEVREGTVSARQLLRDAQLGRSPASELLWLCTACGLCEPNCPRGVPIAKSIRALRDLAWRQGEPAPGLPSVLWSLYWNGNPWSQPPSLRGAWSAGADIPRFDPERHEILLYVGCTCSYDRRAQEIARASAGVLESAGVSYGILGEEEPCCGESALAMGHGPYFHEIEAATTHALLESGASRIIVLSPHCYDVFRNHYPGLAGEIQVLHYTQYLSQLISAGRLSFPSRVSAKKVTFQDPCFLGRRNGEYDAPRQVLAALPGVELVEMRASREGAVCCGGGGGRMWLETPPGERFSDLRVREAAGAASVIATACPFCLSCLEDSVKSMGLEDLQVADVSELVLVGLGTEWGAASSDH
jgi:Fe-S oxidoreductase